MPDEEFMYIKAGPYIEAKKDPGVVDPDHSQERALFAGLVERFLECPGASKTGHGCACLGGCLGSMLAQLRKQYDCNYPDGPRWWSDQLHGGLLIRPGDSGRTGAALNAENYWTGVK